MTKRTITITSKYVKSRTCKVIATINEKGYATVSRRAWLKAMQKLGTAVVDASESFLVIDSSGRMIYAVDESWAATAKS